MPLLVLTAVLVDDFVGELAALEDPPLPLSSLSSSSLSTGIRLAKGAKVAVAGRLRWQSWERDGQTRTKLDVVADEVEFLSAPKAG